MEKITAIILTKNEGKHIKSCLSNLGWCDEIIVVDDYSQDNTVKIAKNAGARVFRRHLDSDFAAQRNFGLTKSRSDWVLFIDADERVSSSLAKEIKSKVGKGCSGFYLIRNTVFLGKLMQGGEWSRAKLLRLARKDSGKWRREVHEEWAVSGKVETLENPLLHHSPTTLAEIVNSFVDYTPVHAKARKIEGKNAYFWQILTFPLAKFFANFLLKRGYLDGVHGFVFSILMSLHSFLSLSTQWSHKNLKIN